MVTDFVNPTIFWEYDVESLDVDQWPPFIIKQVFNRNLVSQPAAIPSLIDYYGRDYVEQQLRQEEWLTKEGIETAKRYFPHMRRSDLGFVNK
jgi:hypothetical protein